MLRGAAAHCFSSSSEQRGPPLSLNERSEMQQASAQAELWCLEKSAFEEVLTDQLREAFSTTSACHGAFER